MITFAPKRIALTLSALAVLGLGFVVRSTQYDDADDVDPYDKVLVCLDIFSTTILENDTSKSFDEAFSLAAENCDEEIQKLGTDLGKRVSRVNTLDHFRERFRPVYLSAGFE